MVRVAEEHRHRQRRANRRVVGHLQAAVPGQRPPQVARQAPHLFDQRVGDRVGFVPVGQRDDHRVAGGAIHQGRHCRGTRSEYEVTLPMTGHLPIVGLDGTLPDGDGVPELAAAMRGPLAQRSPYRTTTAQTVKHAGVECLP